MAAPAGPRPPPAAGRSAGPAAARARSKAAVSPVRAAWTTGRPVSAARTAPSDACWAGAQVRWNVESEVWYTMSWAPRPVSTRDMSGKADSKQISTPRGSGWPDRLVACRRCAPSPGTILLGAALLIRASQPSAARSGMYSPNGTSRVLVYEPAMPCGPISSATLDRAPSGRDASWLTSTSAPVAAASRLICRKRTGCRSMSVPTLLSPQTIRSGRAAPARSVAGPELAGQAQARVDPLVLAAGGPRAGPAPR